MGAKISGGAIMGKTQVFLALDIIADTAMGVELGSQMHNPDSIEYVQNRAAVCGKTFLALFSKTVRNL